MTNESQRASLVIGPALTNVFIGHFSLVIGHSPPMPHVSDVLSARDIAKFSNLQVLARGGGVLRVSVRGCTDRRIRGSVLSSKSTVPTYEATIFARSTGSCSAKPIDFTSANTKKKLICDARFCWIPAGRWPTADLAVTAAPNTITPYGQPPVWRT